MSPAATPHFNPLQWLEGRACAAKQELLHEREVEPSDFQLEDPTSPGQVSLRFHHHATCSPETGAG